MVARGAGVGGGASVAVGGTALPAPAGVGVGAGNALPAGGACVGGRVATALVLVFVGTVGYVATRKKRVAALLAVYGCAMLTSVVLYSQQLIGEARHEIAIRGPGWGPPPADPLREPYLGLFAQR